MNTMELVRNVERARPRSIANRKSAPPFFSELKGPVRQAIVLARQHLLRAQRADGSWTGNIASDTSLASQYVLWLAYHGEEESERVKGLAEAIADQQGVSGGWSVAPDGSPDVSASVQAYFALKLTGIDASDERMRRARRLIRRLGGADAANIDTRFLLALLGQVDYDTCPALPPELQPMRTERRLSVPLSIIWSLRPARDLGDDRGIRELFVDHPHAWPGCAAADRASRRRISQWFGGPIVSLIRVCEHRGWTPLRQRALDHAADRLVERIQPASIERLDFDELIWHAIALHALGFSDDSAEGRACAERLRALAANDEGVCALPRLRTTAFDDTVLSLRALGASGVPANHSAVRCAVRFLVHRAGGQSAGGAARLCESAAALQATDCGEGAHWDSLPPVLDVDHGASEANMTSQDCDESLCALEDLAACCANLPPATPREVTQLLAPGDSFVDRLPHATIRAATEHWRVAQNADGGWKGEGGSGRLGATAQAVCLLATAKDSGDASSIAAGVNWLKVHQTPGGGWSEVYEEERDEARSSACSPTANDLSMQEQLPTSSHTALAVLSLVAAGKANDSATRRGVRYLIESQTGAGDWRDPHFAARDEKTGRWCVNDLGSTAWPLLALSRWAAAASADHEGQRESIPLRLVNELCDH